MSAHDDHTSGAKDPGVRESGQKVWSIFHSAFIVFILVVGVLAIKDTWARWKKAAEEKKTTKATYIAVHPPTPVATTSAQQPYPSMKEFTFIDGSSIITFYYWGGPMIWSAQGGTVDFVDNIGNRWSDSPNHIGAGSRNQKLHVGWHFVSRPRGSKATGVRITQIWRN